LVLDEPTSQLDPQAAEEVLLALRQLNEDLGLTIVLSEHRLERVVQYADRVLYLPALGSEPVVGDPRSVMAQLPWVPPLVRLGRSLGWQPLPLTIKEGRAFARSLTATGADSRGLAQPSGAARAAGAGMLSSELAARAQASPALVSVRDLHYAYRGHPALRGASLDVHAGELVVLMGRNGSGKSTLLKQMAGLLKPERGRVTVAGLDTRSAPLEDIIRHVGYVPQHPGALLFQETLAGELGFTRRSHGMTQDPEADRTLLEQLGLVEAAGRDPRDLSGGEQQRAALAAILVAGPQIVLLDEPTRGLDYAQKAALAGILLQLKAQGRAILMATHDVELAAACADRVVLLGEGEVVVDGPARTVMTGSQVFASQINKLFRDPHYLIVQDVLAALGVQDPRGAEA
jgi:energy-coupling factor transport system ATP-binding protein